MASDLTIKFGSILQTPTIFPDQQGKVQVIVTNQGNQAVTQPFNVGLYASTDRTLDNDPKQGIFLNQLEQGTLQKLRGTDELLGTLKLDANFNPGQSRTLTIDFASNQFRTASVVSPGAYFLIAEVDSGKTIQESNGNNNIASKFISTAKTDVVLDWNSTLLNAIQAEGERLKGIPVNEALPIASPPFAARNAAIVHTAIYDAFKNASGTNASRQAAVVGAAYQTLVKLYPAQRAAFEAQRNRSLVEIKDGVTAEIAGFAKGVRAANTILTERRNDGAVEAQRPFEVPPTPGVWRPTPTRGETAPNKGDALLPGWGEVTPFAIASVEDALPDIAKDGPSELGEDRVRYALAVNAVKSLGRLDSKTRTERQTQTAYFWSYDRPDTFGPVGQWHEIAQEVALDQGNTLEENARLFARLTTAMADAGIAAWDLKYDLGGDDVLGFNQWRPISAIHADITGDGVVSDPNWQPLLDTPPFPDYVSGHAAFGGAAAKILASTFGDQTKFNIPSQDLPGISRTYNRFSGAALENALSRVYGGVHIGEASLDGVIAGLAAGREVANSVLDSFPPLG